MPEQSAQGLNDGDWGFCKHCKFLVPIVPVPFVNAGCLEPHAAGKYAPFMACGYESRLPDTYPHGGEIHAIRRMDKIVADRISRLHEIDPRED